MNRFRNLTITPKLTLLFILFAALILAGVGALAYFSGRAALEQAVTSDLESTANEKHAALDRWLDDHLNLVVSITELPANRARVNSLIHDNLDDAARKTLQAQTALALAGFTGPNGNYLEMMIVEADQGQVIVSTQPENQGKFNEDRPYFVEGLNGPFVQNIIYSLDERAPILMVAAPIRADDGSVIAVLAARLKLDEMNDIILQRTGQRATDDAFLVNSSNLFVTQPQFITDPAVLQRGVHTQPVDLCLAGNSGVIASDDYRGVPVLADYRWLPERQLCLIVKMDQAEAFAPSNEFGQTLALIAVVTLAFASLVGFGLARTISTPIRVLQDRVVRFGRGEHAVRMPELAGDEIGVLAREFNRAAALLAEKEAQLEENAAELERRVEERTTALRETNDYLDNLFNTANAPIIVWDPQFKITRFNRAFEFLTGRSEPEISGKSLEILFPPAQIEALLQLSEKTQTGERWDVVEIDIQPVNSSIRTVLWSSATLFSADGLTPLATIAQGQDITERKRLESEQFQLLDIIEKSLNEIYVFDAATLRFEYLNHGALHNIGYSLAEIHHLTPVEIKPAYTEETFRALVQPLLTRDQDQLVFETRHRRKNGTEYPVEVHLQLIIQDAHRVFLAIINDITARQQADQALRESEQRYRQLFEDMPIAIWEEDFSRVKDRLGSLKQQGITDFQTYFAAQPEALLECAALIKVLDVNQAALQMYHAESKEALLAATHLGLSQGEVEHLAEDFAAIAECKTSNSWEGQDETLTGEPIGVNVSWSVVPGYEDDFSKVIVTTLDITRRKQAEAQREAALEALHASEESLRLAVSAGRMGTWDRNFLVEQLNWSVECKTMFGLAPGTEMNDERFTNALHPDDRTPTDLAIRAALEQQTDFQTEYRVVWPDGTIHWIAAQGRGYYNAAGQATHMAGVTFDITDRKQAEDEVRQLNAELEQRVAERTAELSDLYNNAPCGYHSLNADGVFVRINDTELKWLGYTREEIVGKIRFTDLITPASVLTFQQNFRGFKERGWIHDLEFDMVRRDGSILSILLNATSVTDQDGRYLMSRSTMIDHTERKRAEEALQQRTAQLEASNRELEAFSYSVSHDLRAPLRAIDGFSHILEEDYGPQLDPEARRYVQIVRNNTLQMGRLIDDLLAFSRLSRQPINKQAVEVKALVQQVLDGLLQEEADRTIDLSIADLPPCQADPALLKQVWINLLSNAFKYTSKCVSARIEIGWQQADGQAIYYVRDNGVGFDMQYADKLFGVFQRLHRIEEYPGTGVGLAIVKRVIDRHGGRVWAEAEVDRGATFYFTL